MDPFQKQLKILTDRLGDEMIRIIQVAATERVLKALGLPPDTVPKLPPRRVPKRIGPSQTRGRKEASSKPNEPLKGKLAEAQKIFQEGRPVTTKDLSARLKVSESSARVITSKLLRKKLLTAQPLDDKTNRKAYLLPGK